MSFDAGVDMGFEGGFTGKQEFLADTGEFVAGPNGLGEFHGMFFAFGRTNQVELDSWAVGGNTTCSFRNNGCCKCFVHVGNIAHRQILSTPSFFQLNDSMYYRYERFPIRTPRTARTVTRTRIEKYNN